jgi:hypothetical protein
MFASLRAIPTSGNPVLRRSRQPDTTVGLCGANQPHANTIFGSLPKAEGEAAAEISQSTIRLDKKLILALSE